VRLRATLGFSATFSTVIILFIGYCIVMVDWGWGWG